MSSIPRNTNRVHIHVKLRHNDEESIFPVYIHVQMDHLEWFDANYEEVIDECQKMISQNFEDILAVYHEHSPMPAKASMSPDYSISPVKRIGNKHIILTYAVMRRRNDDYTMINSNPAGSSEYKDVHMGSFSIYLWAKPLNEDGMAGGSHLQTTLMSFMD